MTINLKQFIPKNISASEPFGRGVEFETVSTKEVAIIGISCRFASAQNKEEYWQMLIRGEDCIRDFPENRKKQNEVFLRAKGIENEDDVYFQGGFLSEVDRFDPELFNLSPVEANLMSPNQRVFLETVWSAIEDAGYGPHHLAGTRTGVFLGHSTDFGVNYKEYIEALNPSMASFSISGNLNSIIASRISYLLDLKGPSMVVDTACSGSLAAVHLACRSIRAGECEMALAGAIKIDLLPLKGIKQKEDEIGITSADGRARTFDDSSDGTGLGEGVGAILLKSLSQALEDGDHIYAVVKGSAMNQDGNSVNLTSPNPAAQEDVVIKAWQDAAVHPETITYIEAHGTGTELGDPIEINGLERAFRRYTNKRQFCAIGSVKTNLGHLDNAAGMAGLIKAVLALKNRQIPPSIHFNFPNRKINFEDTPVYVNDILRDWKVEKGVPRRCGISAFGLSGTNCHLILEEAPEVKPPARPTSLLSTNVLTLSAKNRAGVSELVWKYLLFLYSNESVALNQVCFTANTGRTHFNCRLAIVFHNIRDLMPKMEQAVAGDLTSLNQPDIYYGEYRIISEKQKNLDRGETTQFQKEQLTGETNQKLKGYLEQSGDLAGEILGDICRRYVSGADVHWDLIYRNQANGRISLPTYPLARKSCWVSAESGLTTTQSRSYPEDVHPLLERCLADSFDRIIYLSYFNPADYWILNEHKVAGTYVVPGTTYLEMISEVLERHYPGWAFQLQDVIFMTPLAVSEGETVEVHTLLQNMADGMEFTIASRTVGGSQWTTHTEGRVVLHLNRDEAILDIELLKKAGAAIPFKQFQYEPGKGIETGPRWDCIKEIYHNDNGTLTLLAMDEPYDREVSLYRLHPALLDEAVNVSLRSVGEGLYLPFTYKSLMWLERLPSTIYSWVKWKNREQESREIATFDITLTDEAGKVLVLVEDYSIKKADEAKIGGGQHPHDAGYTRIIWEESSAEKQTRAERAVTMVVLKGEGVTYDALIASLKATGKKVVEVDSGLTQQDYARILERFTGQPLRIVFLQTLADCRDTDSLEDLTAVQNKGIYAFLNMVKALGNNRNAKTIEIVFVGQYAHQVIPDQTWIMPHNAAIFGLAQVAAMEQSQLKCKCIDIDESTPSETVCRELADPFRECVVAYRSGKRYVPMLDRLDLKAYEDKPITIKNEGVYVITGGTGGIGLEVAKMLGAKTKVNLALINRSVFPNEEQWAGILEKGEPPKLCNQIQRLLELKQNGATIAFYHADVSDLAGMTEVFADLRARFCKINGIFHAAGNAGDGFLVRRDVDTFKNVILPKIQGTWVLDHLTRKDNLDFLVLFSSITSVLPEAGQGDYTAANSYLDSYASWRSRRGRTVAINWPAWSETGMAINYGVDFAKEVFFPVGTESAIQTLEELLQKKVTNIIAGNINQANLGQIPSHLCRLSNPLIAFLSQKRFFGGVKATSMETSRFEDSKVRLTGGQDELSYTESEIKIAQVLSGVLGLKEINIYDEFLDLGGNSIIAVKVEMDMAKNGLPIMVSDLYEYKTVKGLANFVDHRTEPEGAMTVPEKAVSTISEGHAIGDNGQTMQLSNVVAFNQVFYKTCFHNSLFPVVGYFQKDLLQILMNDLFIYHYETSKGFAKSGMVDLTAQSLNEILGEMALVVETKTHGNRKTKDLDPPQEDIELLEQFHRYIGIDCQNKKPHTDSIIEEIITALAKGRPVIIWVDCFYEAIRMDTFQKEHWMHTLLIYGFDTQRQIFKVIEHNFRENLTYKPKEISFAEVREAYDGFIANYALITSMPTFYEFDVIPGQQQRWLDIGHCQTGYQNWILKNRGKIIQSMGSLQSIIAGIKQMIASEPDLQCGIEDVIPVLNSIINAKKLMEYNATRLFAKGATIAGRITQSIDLWNPIRQILVKYQYSLVYDPGKMREIEALLDQIYQLECDYVKELLGLKESLEWLVEK